MEDQCKTRPLHDIEAVFEHLPMSVAVFDARDLRLLLANAGFRRMLDMYLVPSWQQGRALGHPLRDWLPEAVDARAVVAIFRTVAETGIQRRTDEYAFAPLEDNMTYWNVTLAPLRDAHGSITRLLLTASEVTAQVLARQQLEQAHASLSQEHRAVEAERKRLEVIAAVAQSVQESLDIERVSMAALHAISSRFEPSYVYIHMADPEHQALRLLRIHPFPRGDQVRRAVQYVPYKSAYPIAKAYQHHTPIIIEDLETTTTVGSIEPANLLVPVGARGYICVPLWFGDHFEGTLTAIFKNSIRPDGPEVQTLVGSSMYIAAALAHARLHASIENERARLHAVIDQLPEGIVMTEASDGVVSYANAAAATILGVPLTELIGAPPHRYPQSHLVTDVEGRPVLPWYFTVIHALSGETISSQETMVIRPDGSHVVTLSSAAPIRRENGLITGAALVFQVGDYDEEEEDYGEEEDYEISVPPVPPAFGRLTAAQQALAELLRVPDELLVAAARHSQAAKPSTNDDFVAWIELLPPERRNDYLVRLAHNEPGLSRLLVRELRELGQGESKATPPTGEHVGYATLLAESKAIKTQLEREKREQEQLARLRHLQDIHDHRDAYWHQVEQAVSRGTGSGYDEGVRLLIELREAAEQFKESQEFQDRFRTWVRSHLRRPAFVKRLQTHKFPLPEA